MRFEYNGTRHSEQSGCLIHVFYIAHTKPKDSLLRMSVMDEALVWLDERLPGVNMQASRFGIHIPAHNLAMEFRLRWC